MIVYFSGTGNSRYCAQMLAAQLDDELTDVFHFIRDGIAAELCSVRPWVFVSPTYGWQLPRIFADFIRKGSFTGCKSAYFVMTCGSEIGNVGATLQSLCEEKRLAYQGVLKVVMPENYLAMFPVPDEAESSKIIEAAKPTLEGGTEGIRQGKPFPCKSNSIVDWLKTGMVNPLFYTYCVKAKAFYATDACIGCGKCERGCPMNNVHLKDGKPLGGNYCTHCMACICFCPMEAIEYGKRSSGKPRYQCGKYRAET